VTIVTRSKTHKALFCYLYHSKNNSMIRKTIFTAIIIVSTLQFVAAQFHNPVKWSFIQKKVSDTEFELQFKANIEKGWHLYSDKLPEGGPIPTSFKYDSLSQFELVGTLVANQKPVKVFDKSFNIDVEYFGSEVIFKQKVKVTGTSPFTVSGVVEYMSCNDETCTPPTETDFSFSLGATTSIEKKTEIIPTINEKAPEDTSKHGFFGFLLLSFLAGLIAVITPCVFPMIPMTVSFFMRGSQSRGGAIKTAVFFGGSIIFIFALLGALFTFNVFGANAGSILSTHWIPNAIFFVLFIVFALSFFGLFELVLPGSLVNKTDAKADKGGLIGAFFMALTTVIVSFSCTGPFIGSLIIKAVQEGGLVPLFGMISFGVAFAAPFTLLAIFPSALKKLPKSGGWLNSVKVVFAFILLAMSLKFLNVVIIDLIDRDLYLAIWISLSILSGMYLLGKIKLSHDSDLKHVSVGRLMLALTSFTFSVYLFTGLLGAPLKPISSLIPSQTTVHSTVQPTDQSAVSLDNTPMCGPAKYADKLHLPYNIPGYFDFDQGLACAKEQNKPVFLVFKGHACANCKKMENTVWDQPEVLNMLKKDYVVIALYTDDRTTLPEKEWKKSSFDGKILKTMGRLNLDLLMTKYQKNSIPYHVIIQPNGTEMEMDVTYDNEEFVSFLKKGIK
jgi:thiol:disulfide interchange protein